MPSLVGISHVAIQFPAYEKIKSYFAKRDNTTTSKLSPGKLVIASAVSKLVASVMTYPHEVSVWIFSSVTTKISIFTCMNI
ncbi:unnamed protein product [Camellia sinensis]